MARINLLPWREERRKVRNREAQTLLFMIAAGAVLAVVLVCFRYSGLIDDQNQRNAYIENEIAEVEKKITEVESYERDRSRLISQIRVYESLQESRSAVVRLLNDLVGTIPDGVRLSAIKQSGELITLEGFAESYERVSEYMLSLGQKSKTFESPDLQILEAKDGDKRTRYSFILRVSLKKPKTAEEGGDANVAPKAQGAA